MLPALVEKASYVGAIVALYAVNREPGTMLGVAAIDASRLVLFAVAYWQTR